MWAVRKCDAPIRHGAVGVDLAGRSKRPNRLCMVEIETKRQTVIEVALRQLPLRCNRMMVPSHALETGRGRHWLRRHDERSRAHKDHQRVNEFPHKGRFVYM